MSGSRKILFLYYALAACSICAAIILMILLRQHSLNELIETILCLSDSRCYSASGENYEQLSSAIVRDFQCDSLISNAWKNNHHLGDIENLPLTVRSILDLIENTGIESVDTEKRNGLISYRVNLSAPDNARVIFQGRKENGKLKVESVTGACDYIRRLECIYFDAGMATQKTSY